jgi:hypothetical protein
MTLETHLSVKLAGLEAAKAILDKEINRQVRLYKYTPEADADKHLSDFLVYIDKYRHQAGLKLSDHDSDTVLAAETDVIKIGALVLAYLASRKISLDDRYGRNGSKIRNFIRSLKTNETLSIRHKAADAASARLIFKEFNQVEKLSEAVQDAYDIYTKKFKKDDPTGRLWYWFYDLIKAISLYPEQVSTSDLMALHEPFKNFISFEDLMDA